MIHDLIEVEKVAGSEDRIPIVQRGCATVLNGRMMYFGGSHDPFEVRTPIL